jgi:hypothetical protein
MKLTGIITRSLQADMQAELRNIERAVGTGTREVGRGLRTELRPAGRKRRARAAARVHGGVASRRPRRLRITAPPKARMICGALV